MMKLIQKKGESEAGPFYFYPLTVENVSSSTVKEAMPPTELVLACMVKNSPGGVPAPMCVPGASATQG